MSNDSCSAIFKQIRATAGSARGDRDYFQLNAEAGAGPSRELSLVQSGKWHPASALRGSRFLRQNHNNTIEEVMYRR